MSNSNLPTAFLTTPLNPIYKFALREDLFDTESYFLPTRSEPTATGWDVCAAQKDRQPLIIKPGQYCKIPLGFRGFQPQGWWYELKPRSSSFAKKFHHALYGTVDNGFEGELHYVFTYLPPSHITEDLIINFKEKIGQIIPVKLQEMIVEQVSNEEYDVLCKQRNGIRGAGGFGSSGDIHGK